MCTPVTHVILYVKYTSFFFNENKEEMSNIIIEVNPTDKYQNLHPGDRVYLLFKYA